MDIEQVFAKREEMESKIRNAVVDIISSFEDESGLGIRDVSFDMIDITKMGEAGRYTVGRCNVIVNI